MIIRNKLAGLGLMGQTGVVSATVLCVWLVVAPLAYQVSAVPGLVASATGAAICLSGAALALLIAAVLQGPGTAMHRMVLGMFARTMLPLLAAVALHFKVPSLAQAGMIFYVLVFYMATLTAETVVALAQIPRSPNSGKAV